ncbi:MAG: carboxypeptidase-like regulatory domain-containing protein [Prevotellaceae bacterium]|jgi:hypothetical protein|nr:carboxypeptidase-like regulatory domain-containing protein [Prevotellaceae bacterium]
MVIITKNTKYLFVFIFLLSSLLLHAQNKEFEYKVNIVDSETRVPISLVTVSLINSVDRILVVGLTNDKGVFTTKTPSPAAKIRISGIGYLTIEQSIDSSTYSNELGIFSLLTQENQLEEAIVTGRAARYDVDKVVYYILLQRECEPLLVMRNNSQDNYPEFALIVSLMK